MDKVASEDESQNSVDNGYKCKKYNKSYAHRQSLRNHMKVHNDLHNDEYQCKTCNKSFTRQFALTRHLVLKRCMVKGDLLKCHKCSAVFAKKFNVSRHLTTDCQKQFKCVSCLKEFANKQSLINHMVTHKPKVKSIKPRKEAKNLNAISESCDLMLAYGEDSDLDLNWLFSSGNDSLHDQTISVGDLSMTFNNDCENADETAFGFHELDDDIDINIEFAGPNMQRNDLTPVKSTEDTPAPLTPATRQRKSRIAKEHTAYVQSLELTPEDQVEFLTRSLKQLGIYDLFKFERKPTKGVK